MAKITYNGYTVKNANEWYTEESDRYLAIDSDWNLDASTPDGLKIATDSEIWATLDEIGLEAYNSKDPNKATGTALDTLLYLTTGATRSDGTPSTVTLTLSGVDGTVIPSGSKVSSSPTGYQWETTEEVALSGDTDVSAQCTENGVIEASIGTITSIDDPVSGWQSVTNNSIATPGTNAETDAEVRKRRNLSVAKVGQNQIDTMISELLSVDDVIDAAVPENDTGSVDSNGLPAHSIAPIVDGGTDLDVATAIYNEKNPGCELYAANTAVEVKVTSEATGNVKTITFSRPDYVDMIIGVSVTDDGSLPGNIEDLISEAIIDYSQGELLDTGDEFRRTGFSIGNDVSAGQLFTPVNSVVGQYGNSYATGIAINGGSVAVIAFNEKARFTTDNITVTVS